MESTISVSGKQTKVGSSLELHVKNQIASTLKKYYSGIENLILLKVETLKLDHLVWEQASDGNFFPHLYSSLDLSNVVNEFEITLNNDGTHKLPDTL